MQTLLAIGHIVGAFIALETFGLVLVTFLNFRVAHYQKKSLQRISFTLSLPVDEIDNEENSAKVLKYFVDRYDPDLLRNRLSDLCGSLQMVWKWIGYLLQYGFLIGVSWFTFTESLANAVNAWFVLLAAVFVFISTWVFGMVCLLLTGRGPGEAKRERDRVSAIVLERRSRGLESHTA